MKPTHNTEGCLCPPEDSNKLTCLGYKKEKTLVEKFIKKFRPKRETPFDELRSYIVDGMEVERWLKKVK